MSIDNIFIQGNDIKVLCFTIFPTPKTSINLAINIQKVVEIVHNCEIEILPTSYYPIIGNINYKGLPVPTVYLPHYYDRKFEGKNDRIIICEFQNINLGIIVDQTKRIITINNQQLLPVPAALDISGINLYNGVIQGQNNFIYLLDIEQLLINLKISCDNNNITIRKNQSLIGKVALVVEDSKLFAKKMCQILEKLQMNFLLATDGEEGLKLYEKNHKEIDIIFTDIEMPKLNGIGMIRKIKKLNSWKNIPVVFATSISNPGLIKDITNEGLGEYCIKFDENEILNALNNLLVLKQ